MTAGVASIWRLGRATRTVRHFRAAVGFALAAVAVGVLIYAAERFLFRPERRFVENPASVMMRACGLAHFWIGWLFLFTSPRLRGRGPLLRLAALTALGAALSLACAAGGAAQSPFVFLFFYGFFLVHEVRDETSLYQRRGDAPACPAGRRFLRTFRQAVTVNLCGLLVAAYLLFPANGKRVPVVSELSPAAYLAILVGLACLAFLTSRRAAHSAQREYGSVPAALAAHAPLVLVYFGILSVLLLALVAGSVSFNLIILIHAGAWFVFVCDRLRREPPPARRNLWTWLRHTPAGFVTLHLALIAFILVMKALRVYVWQRAGLVSDLFAGSSFPYWSLMHITMSFWRPR